MSFDARVTELGLALPSAPQPVATYVPAVLVGDLMFMSGIIPFRDGVLVMQGKLGQDLTVEQGYECARTAGLNALAGLRQQLGTLDRVIRMVKLVGYVASSNGFNQQPGVINGASDLLVQVFGDAGRHARVAVGASELPLNAPVEIELIVHVGREQSTRLP